MAGIECEFAEKVSKGIQYERPICLLVLREPYQAICCGKSFCKKCIDRVKGNNQDCPTCNERNFNLFYNKGLEQSLYDFEVYCSHKIKGCEWRGELRELDKHLNSEPLANKSFEGCPFTVISCPLGHTGCDMNLPRKDIKIHVNDELLGHVVKQTALMTALNAQLQKQNALVMTLTQDNKSLNTKLQNVNAELQLVKGDLQLVKGDLQLLKGEKLYLEQHVAELEGEIIQVKKTQIKEVKQTVAHTGQPIGPVEFTMTNFNQYQDDKHWYSPPFYTHPHGYKMCLRVTPKGWGYHKGTHLGVAIYMMRGEFDDQLKWPFRGNITYQLMNQEEDKDHVVKTVYFNENTGDHVAGRVTGRERSSNGRGRADVHSFSELEPKYLKNNCIKLCITKVVLT